MAASEYLGRQWQAPAARTAQAPEYPTKGWRKASDRTTAQQRLMGASRGYDARADSIRKGIEPSLN